MGVQACRLPCFILQPTGTPRPHINGFLWASKPAVCQPLNPCLKNHGKRLKTLTTRHGGPSLPFAMLHPAANRHPKATHQWLLMGVQACRLPALKPPKRVMGVRVLTLLRVFKGFKGLRAGKRSWGSKPAVCHASSCSQQAPQGHTSMASYGRPSLPFTSP